MFSTSGFPAQFAREVVNAFGALRVQKVRKRAPWRHAVPQMNLSPTSANALNPAAAVADSTSAAESDQRVLVHQLYQEHSQSLVRQLARKTGCREVARELANETFLRLLRMAPGGLGRIEQPEAFLRQVSANLLRDWGRVRKFKERSQAALQPFSEQQLDQLAVLESRDTLRRLEHAISKLKPKTREIFLAHRIHGFTYAQIAERTGLSVKGVEKQMSKAIAKIDRLLDRG
jgi:RNA polymerase sigma-70 factor (ECF subfamily)